ncbi:ABC transporter permease [Pseudonocardia sulfidoxydans NBRC 16205]|uniref:ABC transporter permease n=1 Tax=Pseudonocardia sulfidoxydans NBRC 16205 TaxID=1223511 RepID=A0A511DFH3_9PSEU|nr:hypothetical protein [Pseudonocardia sulfidoxydans]GEL23536.1 ABC transporter permease [Pseudonocardia sulfidoxydans NBRC 16205]
MSAVAAERIKLMSTRSPWWTSAVAVVIVIGLTAVVVATWSPADGSVPFAVSGYFATFGMVVVMVMATVSVTSEYRFGTIRTTFQAVPNRTAALLAKAAVVVPVAGVVGLLAGFGSWGVAWLISPTSMSLSTGAEWRVVAGIALVWAVGAVIALAVGVLVRQTAGAVTLLLVWVLLVENLIGLIPRVGADIQSWLPFVNATNFLTGGGGDAGAVPSMSTMHFGPWGSLAWFAGVAVVLMAIALAVANRRDA